MGGGRGGGRMKWGGDPTTPRPCGDIEQYDTNDNLQG